MASQLSPPQGHAPATVRRPGWLRFLVVTAIILFVALAATVLAIGPARTADVAFRGAAYLTDDPKACLNCHQMKPEYESWFHSRHSTEATCNDCHLPRGLLTKWAGKAQAGLRHTYKFYTGDHPINIRIESLSKSIVQGNCQECHRQLVNEVKSGDGRYCFDCHRSTPHG